MVPQENRLNRVAFTDTYANGRRVHMSGLLLVYLAAPAHKMAIVVGKKVAKSAVARNRIRRQLYAILRKIKIPNGHIIVVAKPAARAYSYTRLCAEVATALKRVGAEIHSR